MQHLATFTKSIGSGVFITIGCAVLLSSGDRIAGALLFTVALCSICTLGVPLYTGAAGFARSAKDYGNLGIMLLGNLAGCLIMGFLLSTALPDIKTAAIALTERKDYPVYTSFVLSFACGILMYAAVYTYRKKHSYIGILTCVPAFIIAGFEHSIAYMGYISLACRFTVQEIVNLLIFVIGNGIGALAMSFIEKPCFAKAAEERDVSSK